MKKHFISGQQHLMKVAATIIACIGTMNPIASNAQSGMGSLGEAIISGEFQVASDGGTLSGDPALASGSLSFGIPSPAGVGLFNTERLKTPGPFGHGTVLFPTATSASVDLGSMIISFTNGRSKFKDFGDKRTLTSTPKGLVLFDPNQGSIFFEQKISYDRYAISRIVNLDETTVAVFSYAPGASLPSSISLNGGERNISLEKNAFGNITRISVDGMVATYSYVVNGGSNLLSEVTVDGNSVLKLTWEQGLPTSSRNAYGEVEMYAFIRKWSDRQKVALAGVVGRDGTVSTIEYTARMTLVRVDGVPYTYMWEKNPALGNTYPSSVYKAGRLLGTTKVYPNGRVFKEEDEFGSVTSYTWHTQPSAVPRTITMPDGTVITNTVNEADDVTLTTRKSPSGFTTTYSYAYDQARRLVRYEVKDGAGDSSATTAYTYSGIRAVPDAITSEENSTVRFSTRGRVESLSRHGETFSVSSKNGGKVLGFTSNGIVTNVTRGASSSGVYSLSMMSPLVKVTSQSDPLRGSNSNEVFRLGQSAGGASGASMASLATTGLMTNAFAASAREDWLPALRWDMSRGGTAGNYTYNQMAVWADGTITEKSSAKRNSVNGACESSSSWSFEPAGIHPTPPPQPTVQPSRTPARMGPFPPTQPTRLPRVLPPRPTIQPTKAVSSSSSSSSYSSSSSSYSSSSRSSSPPTSSYSSSGSSSSVLPINRFPSTSR